MAINLSKDELSSYGKHISITTVDEPTEVGIAIW